MRNLLALFSVCLGLGVYLAGAMGSPMLDRSMAERRRMLEAQVLGQTVAQAAEAVLAEAYWSRYPDVAQDPVFGRTGRIGLGGAREHYDRHGRVEGRIWGY